MSSKQYTYFPIEYPQIHNLLQKQFANFWTVEEVDTSEDKKHWTQLLKANEKEFIKWTLAFFASADGIVIENLGKRFFEDINNSEGKAFYAFQMGMEAIHSLMYSVLIDTYVSDSKEKDKMFNAIEEIAPIKAKANWALKWISDESNYAKRCIAFAIVEGIFFSAAFCSIYWLKDRGVCPGLCLSNDFIARDEALHVEHACEQYKIIVNENPSMKLSTEEVHNMVKSAIETEDIFINEALKFKLKGMNAELMKEYVRYTANHLLGMLGYNKLYNVENPFDFMDRISMDQLNNFFEGRSSVYQRSGIMDSSRHSNNNNMELNKESVIKLIEEFIESQGIQLENSNSIIDWYNERENGYKTYSLNNIDNFDF